MSDMKTARHIKTLRTVTGIAAAVCGFALLLLPGAASAACSSPAGTIGNMEYFSGENLYKYCDDTNWIDVGSASNGVTSGLVGWWKLDGNGNDSVGTGNATPVGSPSYVSGISGQGLSTSYNEYLQAFDGNSSSIADFGTNDFSVCFWIQSDGGSAVFGNTVGKWNGGAGGNYLGWGFSYWGPTQLRLNLSSGVPTSGDYVYFSATTTGSLHHLCLVRNSGNVAVWFDGTQVVDHTNGSSISTTTGFRMGQWGGLVDDVRIYNRALTAAEVATLAQTEDATSLVLHWKLDEGTGTSAADASGAGNTGTMYGSPAWTTNGYINAGLTFDGNDDCIRESGVDLSSASAATVSFWSKRDWSTGTYETVHENTNDFNGSTTGFALFFSGDGVGGSPCGSNSYDLEPSIKGNTGYNIKCYTPPSDTNWHLITTVFDKSQAGTSEILLYIDGLLQTPVYIPPSYTANNTNNFGADSFNFMDRNCTSTPSPAESITGTSDEVRIYSKALNATEIAGLIDCTSPAGKKGMVQYDTTDQRFEYCNGKSWVAMDTTCSVGNGGAGCTGGVAGTMRYNGTNNTYEYCEGDTWVCVGEKCSAPTIGNACSDGTVYAGLSPDGNKKMFTTRCDLGMTWNGSSCTGTRSSPPWNNGNAANFVTTNTNSVNTGATNTAIIISLDSDSGTGGTQPHQAAQACADLVLNGYDDWYLPARAELDVLYTNRVAIGNFLTSGGTAATSYWSSTEQGGGTHAFYRDFENGASSSTNKEYATQSTRCVRKQAN